MAEKDLSPEDEFFMKEDLEKLKAIRAQRDAERAKLAEEQKRQQHWMKCPKCGHDLKETMLRELAVDVCTNCGGVWFDSGELETLIGSNENVIKRVFGAFRSSLKFGEPINDAPGGLEKK
jgi:hypothetical protein